MGYRGGRCGAACGRRPYPRSRRRAARLWQAALLQSGLRRHRLLRAAGAATLHHGRSMTDPVTLTHIQRLEAESIHIIREVVAEAEKPVMLYSIGKDSATMLHLARKAF